MSMCAVSLSISTVFIFAILWRGAHSIFFMESRHHEKEHSLFL